MKASTLLLVAAALWATCASAVKVIVVVGDGDASNDQIEKSVLLGINPAIVGSDLAEFGAACGGNAECQSNDCESGVCAHANQAIVATFDATCAAPACTAAEVETWIKAHADWSAAKAIVNGLEGKTILEGLQDAVADAKVLIQAAPAAAGDCSKDTIYAGAVPSQILAYVSRWAPTFFQMEAPTSRADPHPNYIILSPGATSAFQGGDTFIDSTNAEDPGTNIVREEVQYRGGTLHGTVDMAALTECLGAYTDSSTAAVTAGPVTACRDAVVTAIRAINGDAPAVVFSTVKSTAMTEEIYNLLITGNPKFLVSVGLDDTTRPDATDAGGLAYFSTYRTQTESIAPNEPLNDVDFAYQLDLCAATGCAGTNGNQRPAAIAPIASSAFTGCKAFATLANANAGTWSWGDLRKSFVDWAVEAPSGSLRLGANNHISQIIYMSRADGASWAADTLGTSGQSYWRNDPSTTKGADPTVRGQPFMHEYGTEAVPGGTFSELSFGGGFGATGKRITKASVCDWKTFTGTGKVEKDVHRVGIMHSLSGGMAISERTVVDADLMAIDELNKGGGLLGQIIVPTVIDGSSDFGGAAEGVYNFDNAARQMTDTRYYGMATGSTVFGCWTSVSRKRVLPVFQDAISGETHKGQLWYPVQYEGNECSKNVFYTGQDPTQQIQPGLDYLLTNFGPKVYVVASDYVFPRTASQVIRNYMERYGGVLMGERYVGLGDNSHVASWKIQAMVDDIVSKLAPYEGSIFNTLNGNANVIFFKKLFAAGYTGDKAPVMSVSIGEPEVAVMNSGGLLLNQLASWTYFHTVDNTANKRWIANFQNMHGYHRVMSDPMECAYNSVQLWKRAVELGSSFDTDDIRRNAIGLSIDAPSGTAMIGNNHHLAKHARIGKVNSMGLLDVVMASPYRVTPRPWSDFVPHELQMDAVFRKTAAGSDDCAGTFATTGFGGGLMLGNGQCTEPVFSWCSDPATMTPAAFRDGAAVTGSGATGYGLGGITVDTDGSGGRGDPGSTAVGYLLKSGSSVSVPIEWGDCQFNDSASDRITEWQAAGTNCDISYLALSKWYVVRAGSRQEIGTVTAVQGIVGDPSKDANGDPANPGSLVLVFGAGLTIDKLVDDQMIYPEATGDRNCMDYRYQGDAALCESAVDYDGASKPVCKFNGPATKSKGDYGVNYGCDWLAGKGSYARDDVEHVAFGHWLSDPSWYANQKSAAAVTMSEQSAAAFSSDTLQRLQLQVMYNTVSDINLRGGIMGKELMVIPVDFAKDAASTVPAVEGVLTDFPSTLALFGCVDVCQEAASKVAAASGHAPLLVNPDPQRAAATCYDTNNYLNLGAAEGEYAAAFMEYVGTTVFTKVLVVRLAGSDPSVIEASTYPGITTGKIELSLTSASTSSEITAAVKSSMAAIEDETLCPDGCMLVVALDNTLPVEVDTAVALYKYFFESTLLSTVKTPLVRFSRAQGVEANMLVGHLGVGQFYGSLTQGRMLTLAATDVFGAESTAVSRTDTLEAIEAASAGITLVATAAEASGSFLSGNMTMAMYGSSFDLPRGKVTVGVDNKVHGALYVAMYGLGQPAVLHTYRAVTGAGSATMTVADFEASISDCDHSPEVALDISTGAVSTLVIISIILVGGMGGWLFVKKDHLVVKRDQQIGMIAFTLGALLILVGAGIVSWAYDVDAVITAETEQFPTAGTCSTRAGLMLTGGALMLAGLAIRVRYMYQAYFLSLPVLDSLTFTLVQMGAIVLPLIVIALVSGIDNTVATVSVNSQYSIELTRTVLVCDGGSGDAITAAAVLLGTTLLVTLFYALKVRGIKANYNATEQTMVSTIVMVICTAIFLSVSGTPGKTVHPMTPYGDADLVVVVGTLLVALFVLVPRVIATTAATDDDDMQESQYSQFLSSPGNRACLWLFAVATHNEDQIEFLDAVFDFERMCRPKMNTSDLQRKGTAAQIYNRFIARNSVCEVNVDDDLRRNVAEKHGSGMPDLFDGCKKEIVRLVQANLHAKFVKSNFFEISQDIRQVMTRIDQYEGRVRRSIAQEIMQRVEDGTTGSALVENIDDMLKRDSLQNDLKFKILFVGAGESGKTTVSRHLHFIHDEITPTERNAFKPTLESNCSLVVMKMIGQVETLAGTGGVTITPGTQKLISEVKNAAKFGAQLGPELAAAYTTLWSCAEFQAVWSNRDKFWNLEAAPKYVAMAGRLADPMYCPTFEECLFARIRTTGIQTTSVVTQDLAIGRSNIMFELTDVGGQRSERRKWINAFDDVEAVCFVVNLAGCFSVLFEDETRNRMQESLEVWDKIANEKAFKQTSFFVLFNKKDLLEKELETRNLKSCFPEYAGNNSYDDVVKTIVSKFKAIRSTFQHVCVSAISKNDMKDTFNLISTHLIGQNKPRLANAMTQLEEMSKKKASGGMGMFSRFLGGGAAGGKISPYK